MSSDAAAARDLQTANRELSAQLRELLDRERSLETARAHYADLFDFAPVTYALIDTIGIVLTVNLSGCRLLNVDRKHLVGHPLHAFVVQEDRRELLDHLRRCRSRKDVVESEIRFSSHGSRPVTCRLYSKRASYDGRDAFPTVIIDQTERLALDEARLQAERRTAQAERDAEVAQSANAAKDRFLATVSHELRTPLTPAVFAATRLAEWEGLPDQVRQLAATIKRNIEVESHLIDDLLDVARINRERISLRLESVDVHHVVDEAIRICQPLAESKRLVTAAHLLAAGHYVNADRMRLRQVFWNLLNNAIKFSDAGGSIVIRSGNPSDGVVRVSIRDGGAGMDENVLEHLFAPFDRDRPAEHRESRAGLGLGLAICKGIVDAHGGQIWATSDGPGRGSMVAVELAAVPKAERKEAVEGPPGAGHDGTDERSQQRRVLIIEDDHDSAEMLAMFLSHHGFDVEVASSLRAGMNRLNEHWDIVLSDIGLADGSGLEIARLARGLPQPPQRLIAFSGYGSSDDVRASREAGFDEHVIKPIDLDGLLTAVGGESEPQEPQAAYRRP